jgi:polysaccharide deacetylase 2 family uncharacterized protein YibQ
MVVGALVGAAIGLAALFIQVNLHNLLGAAARHGAAIVVAPLVRHTLQLLRAILAPSAGIVLRPIGYGSLFQEL